MNESAGTEQFFGRFSTRVKVIPKEVHPTVQLLVFLLLRFRQFSVRDQFEMEFTDLSLIMQETDEDIQRQVARSGSAFYSVVPPFDVIIRANRATKG